MLHAACTALPGWAGGRGGEHDGVVGVGGGGGAAAAVLSIFYVLITTIYLVYFPCILINDPFKLLENLYAFFQSYWGICIFKKIH